MAMVQPDFSYPAASATSRIALAHGTNVATQRNATIFLWSFEQLIGCFNGGALDRYKEVTVHALLSFIESGTLTLLGSPYKTKYRLAMAPVKLEPYNTNNGRDSKPIRCRPVLPPYAPELRSDKKVSQLAGDYIIFAKDSSGNNIYQPDFEATSSESISEQYQHHAALFSSLKHERAASFFERVSLGVPLEEKATDALKNEANQLPHNYASSRCVVTGSQTGCEGAEGSVRLGWIYPPPIFRHYHKGPKGRSNELPKESWKRGSQDFNVPSNLIAMREDIYHLFHNHAFAIDVDVRGFTLLTIVSRPNRKGPRPEIYIFDSSEEVRAKIPRYLAVEVHDEKAKAFLREHFLQCLFSGIFGGDVKDQLDCSDNNIKNMLASLPKPNGSQKMELPKREEWPQDERWDTGMGRALKEWALRGVGGDEDEEEDD